MGSWDLTDGLWVWPEGLAHYVDVHSISLPEEFVSHVLSGPTRTKPEESRDYDFDYWVRWCAARRSPAIIAGLRAALATTQVQVSLRKAERANVLEKKYGLSGARCTWTQCDRGALTGKLICAEHSLGPPDIAAAEIPLSTGLQEYLRQLTK